MSNQTGNSTADVIRLDAKRVSWREIDGEIVAVDMQTAEYLTMNGTGAVIWEALAAGTTQAGLANRLADEYEISPHRAGEDVAAFLQTLRERGLVSAGA
jgi:hypothetical protein